MRVVSLRFGIILARDAEAFRRLVRPARLGLGGPMGSGRQWWPWVHVDDVVGIAQAALADDRYAGRRERDRAERRAASATVAKTLGRVAAPPGVPAGAGVRR